MTDNLKKINILQCVMVNKNDFLKRIARLYVAAVILYIFDGIGASSFYGPSFATIESVDSFETRTVTHIEDCKAQCERWTSCKIVNYRIRGRMCYLVHQLGGMAINIRKNRTPGFVSWTKPVSPTQLDNCLQCDLTRSCEVNPTDGTCKISACGKPLDYSSISLHGNMYIVGSRLAYMCSDHGTNETYPHFIECAADGTWTNLRTICAYTSYNLPDGTAIEIRVVNTLVNKTTAVQKCQADGASLITVLSIEKLQLLRVILSGLRVNYWIDTERVNDTYWQTSDGRVQPMGSDMVYFDTTSHYCARLNSQNYRIIHDMRCSRDYGYICERFDSAFL